MLDVMHMLQDVKVDLILEDIEIPKDFNILQSADVWIVDTFASNDGTTQRKCIMYLRKGKSFWVIWKFQAKL